MNDAFVYLALGLVGAVMGSFAGATVWRLRARQLDYDQKHGEPVDGAEYAKLKPLLSKSAKADRSRCLKCKHQLAWYDLIPLFSWLSLGGKCRYCRKPIGWYEPLAEIGVAGLFVASYALWPLPLEAPLMYALFGLWLICCVLLTILFIYDLKWYLLPDKIVFPLIGLAAIYALVNIFFVQESGGQVSQDLFSLAGGVFILSGLYLLLYLVSKGAWIGFGDVKLGIALGLLVLDWRLAFLTLFLANLLGLIVILPGMKSGKLTRESRVPFGPFLIAATVIAVLFGERIINWYLALTLLPI